MQRWGIKKGRKMMGRREGEREEISRAKEMGGNRRGERGREGKGGAINMSVFSSCHWLYGHQRHACHSHSTEEKLGWMANDPCDILMGSSIGRPFAEGVCQRGKARGVA